MRVQAWRFIVVWVACAPALGADGEQADSAALAEACSAAYRHEDLAFVYRHCPFEAWALARAQCERGDETVAPRYAAFCRDFKNGRAPVAGAAP